MHVPGRYDMGRVHLHGGTVFVCYAHSDNSSEDRKLRWLDRFLEFLRPLIRHDEAISIWSDKQIEPGERWHNQIQGELNGAGVGVLLVTPEFLASDYIAKSEVPVLLKNAADNGLKILPLIISPCLYEETKFRYPDWRIGPHTVAVNPPSQTLAEMLEGEQNRVLLAAARQLSRWLEEKREHAPLEAARARAILELRIPELRKATVAAKIEEWARDVSSTHEFKDGICSRCGNSAQAVAHFGWFQCEGQ